MGIHDKAVDAAKKVAETAQKCLSAVKDKGQTVVLKRKVNGFTGEIGQLVLRQKNGESGLDVEIDRLVGEARAVEAEIKALDEA